MFQIFLLFLLWFEFVQNQCWNGYNGACMDPYSQSYVYGQPGLDYTQYLQLYLNPYTQPNIYDYQQYYNAQDSAQKPIVIIINEDDRDGLDVVDVISLITSLKDKPNEEPIYVPYPVPVKYDCDYDYDFDWEDDYLDCGCKNRGGCKSCRKNDRYDHDDCECRKKKPKSKCGSDRCSDSARRCNKYDSIKHKSDCFCRL